ncbi:MAG: type-F conjugative transfer system protein TraW [Alphaproteobacteria bacterium]|nr:type-F conjugative transfer system protein TraW [Alphaproteobacteria bacterium]
MKLVFFLLSQCVLLAANAQDLGVFGETFEVAEEDFLHHMMSKLQKMNQTGELKIAQNKVQEKIKENITHPPAVQGITETEKEKEYKFDPTITATRDLSDHNGKIFARAGEQFNPLDQVKMSPMLFINGNSGKQVSWALKKVEDRKIFRHDFAKIVLVKGSPFDLQEKLNRQIFFDQHGFLTKKLGIEHVPAIVFQNPWEKVLTIREEVAE